MKSLFRDQPKELICIAILRSKTEVDGNLVIKHFNESLIKIRWKTLDFLEKPIFWSFSFTTIKNLNVEFIDYYRILFKILVCGHIEKFVMSFYFISITENIFFVVVVVDSYVFLFISIVLTNLFILLFFRPRKKTNSEKSTTWNDCLWY